MENVMEKYSHNVVVQHVFQKSPVRNYPWLWCRQMLSQSQKLAN